MKETIVVIPARGGSKGIPRKNLRPLAGKPLIYYAIQASKNSKNVTRVLVSTEDDEIAVISERLGAEVIMRPKELAGDLVPLDPVIADAVTSAESKWNLVFDFIITVQPTSPLIRSGEIDRAIKILNESNADTVLSVVSDRHLRWTRESGVIVPLYKERVNRQELPICFKETGAIIGCTREQLARGSRIGTAIELLEMDEDRSFDIDSLNDLYLCEAVLKRKRIVFVVIGYPEVGMGHVYRSVMIANELVNFDIVFICGNKSKLASDFIKSKNYSVVEGDEKLIPELIIGLDPSLVINDILDTSAEFVSKLKNENIKVVNFEDLGPGSEHADLVINALYPREVAANNVLTGVDYFCLRDEFLLSSERAPSSEVKRILLTFGGVDEGNVTSRVAGLISSLCIKKNIFLDIVAGPGFKYENELIAALSLDSRLSYNYSKGISRISDNMLSADIAITSGGRTVLELASLKIPTIVICQNFRETTHTFANTDNGIINLGLHSELLDNRIFSEVEKLINDSSYRQLMYDKMIKLNLKSGKERVISKIKALII